MPVTVALEMLDKDALVKILTEPKNALTKQYQKMLELDGVKLTFDKKHWKQSLRLPEEKDGSQRFESDYGKYHDGYHV